MVVDSGSGPSMMTADALVRIWEEDAARVTAVCHEVRDIVRVCVRA